MFPLSDNNALLTALPDLNFLEQGWDVVAQIVLLPFVKRSPVCIIPWLSTKEVKAHSLLLAEVHLSSCNGWTLSVKRFSCVAYIRNVSVSSLCVTAFCKSDLFPPLIFLHNSCSLVKAHMSDFQVENVPQLGVILPFILTVVIRISSSSISILLYPTSWSKYTRTIKIAL